MKKRKPPDRPESDRPERPGAAECAPEIEISTAMSQAGGRAVALYLSRPYAMSAEGWEAGVAAEAYRAMRRVDASESD